MKFPVKKESGGYSLGGGRGQSLCVFKLICSVWGWMNVFFLHKGTNRSRKRGSDEAVRGSRGGVNVALLGVGTEPDSSTHLQPGAPWEYWPVLVKGYFENCAWVIGYLSFL